MSPSPTPIDWIEDPLLQEHGVRLAIKRDDLLHPGAPGNKWRKLKFNIAEAQLNGASRIVTFGGAYSNHLYASASAAAEFGFAFVACVRGEEHLPLNPVLQHIKETGADIRYVDRHTFRQVADGSDLEWIRTAIGEGWVLPEGGANALALKGVSEIVGELPIVPDLIVTACGTGATLAGLACTAGSSTRILGVPVLKAGPWLDTAIGRLLDAQDQGNPAKWELDRRFLFGGYARATTSLVSFAAAFEQRYGIAADWTYVAKALYAVYDRVAAGMHDGQTIVFLHTGGIAESASSALKIRSDAEPEWMVKWV